MNNFFRKITGLGGHRRVSSHPELYHDSGYGDSLDYTIALALSAGYYDAPRKSNNINWKLI